ncbi:hypothetical protein [Ochrobactrum soli]|uniref:GlsB/YeaQ/YmgE family stress response membrane protein n=1 Tax=Ochrobactrum soli TaxID=2448455 RepID=A0A849KWW6_9HYPH|nr:hypothetical protein [[Ochrobactrum] soli]NNU62978.1 hypothetical protein [[Ochrobactrum] soli]
MISVVTQLLGGFLGGTVFGKIVHTSDMGFFWNAVIGTIGGVIGGQLIGLVLGKTEVATGVDVIAVIGPFVDGALSGALVQIFAGIMLRRLLEGSTARRRSSYF